MRPSQDRMSADAGRQASGDPRYVVADLGDGLRFWVSMRDRHVSRGMWMGMWEPNETAFVKRVLKPRMHAIDIGANLGWYTVHFAVLAGDDGRVTAFEPRKDIHLHLCNSVALNGLCNVTVHNVALGASEGECLLRWPRSDENPGATQVHRGSPSEAEPSLEFLFQKATVRTLDVAVQDRVDFIKIDVEGAEKMVLDGAARILANDRPLIVSELAPAMLESVSNVRVDEYLSYIGRAGYRVYELGMQGRLSHQLTRWPYLTRDIVNVVLVPSERPVQDL